MKILLLCQALVFGGTQRQIALLARGLKQRGHDVSVAVFYGGGPFADELAAAGVPIHDLAKRGRWDVVGFAARLRRLVTHEQPDVVYAFLPVANILAALVKRLVRSAPRVVFGVRSSRMVGAAYDWLTRQQYRMEALFSGAADLAIVNSQDGLADVVARGFRAARVVVVPNGIDTVRFVPDPAGRKRLRAKWGIGDRDILVGQVARFDPMKGHDVFFAAASLLAREDPAWRFVCIGVADGDERARARRLAEATGIGERIIWAGTPSAMTAPLSTLDIACLASRFGEGFPNAVAEAMACGVPCVVTDVGDARAIVGDCGIVVPVGDATALADGLRALRSRGLADRATPRRYIVERYGVKALVDRTERELRVLLA